ncbi:hypothetical protein SAY86_029622 [Trapa natans]|uniref:rRNA methylase YtqB n=1 Tax=Trapa natans TaxID=22666 RepID=A0AAN7RGA1_TRANT|nr:hypothetical protein SAY86_029622 [Trapa natans]
MGIARSVLHGGVRNECRSVTLAHRREWVRRPAVKGMSLRFSPLSWRSVSGRIAGERSTLIRTCGFYCLSVLSPPSYDFPISSKILFRCGTSSSSSFQDTALHGEIPISGVEDELVGYIFGKKKATDVAHAVWKHVVRRGDTVVDATCGNGYDTLALLRLVADSSGKGRVFGMDIQEEALESTDRLLSQSLAPNEKELVKLFPMCHSKMEEIIPKDTSVRLVAFNLGYLPGGDKEKTTMTETTLLALEAAVRIIQPGGLISVVVYVGHPRGSEEFEAIQAFISGLPTEAWICSKLQMLNRPLAPIPVFMFKR